MKKFKFLLVVFFLTTLSASAQVKIGDNPTSLNGDAVLEMESANKGLLLPRVALTSTSAAAPLSAHVQGMTVYNTATAGDVTPGYYYNNGTKWVRLADATANWYLQGTTTDAIGTKDKAIERQAPIYVSIPTDNPQDFSKTASFSTKGFNSSNNIYGLENLVLHFNDQFPTSGWYGSTSLYNANLCAIPTGVSNTGFVRGAYDYIVRSSGDGNNNGNLLNLIGHDIVYGHAGSAEDGSGTTTNAYGMRINPYMQFGSVTNSYDLYIYDYSQGDISNVTNKYGLYVLGASKTNYFEGKVGIGTNAPVGKLDVQGTIFTDKAFGLNNTGALTYLNDDGRLFLGPLAGSSGNGATITINGSNNSSGGVQGGIIFRPASVTNNPNMLTLTSPNGFVGIGTISPSEKLDVKGAIKISSELSYTNLSDGATTPVPAGGAGTMVFDATTSSFYGWTGTEWKKLHN